VSFTDTSVPFAGAVGSVTVNAPEDRLQGTSCPAAAVYAEVCTETGVRTTLPPVMVGEAIVAPVYVPPATEPVMVGLASVFPESVCVSVVPTTELPDWSPCIGTGDPDSDTVELEEIACLAASSQSCAVTP
jgi:hypothetical protein